MDWPSAGPYLMAGYRLLSLHEAGRRAGPRGKACEDSDEEDLEAMCARTNKTCLWVASVCGMKCVSNARCAHLQAVLHV